MVGLSQASCRNCSTNGFSTSEQRWNAVRMYSSLQPRWQLSLQHKTPTPVRLGPLPPFHPRFAPRSATRNVKRGGVLRFGAGVGRHLLHQLAVHLVLHEAVVGAQLRMWVQKKEILLGLCWVEKVSKMERTFDVRTFSMVATKSCSV